MGETLSSFFTHPVVLIILAIAAVLLFFFLLRKLFKWVLILILVLLVGLCLYYGFTTPGGYKEKMRGAVEKTKEQGEAVLKKGKETLLEEGRKLTREFGKKKEDWGGTGKDRSRAPEGR